MPNLTLDFQACAKWIIRRLLVCGGFFLCHPGYGKETVELSFAAKLKVIDSDGWRLQPIADVTEIKVKPSSATAVRDDLQQNLLSHDLDLENFHTSLANWAGPRSYTASGKWQAPPDATDDDLASGVVKTTQVEITLVPTEFERIHIYVSSVDVKKADKDISAPNGAAKIPGLIMPPAKTLAELEQAYDFGIPKEAWWKDKTTVRYAYLPSDVARYAKIAGLPAAEAREALEKFYEDAGARLAAGLLKEKVQPGFSGGQPLLEKAAETAGNWAYRSLVKRIEVVNRAPDAVIIFGGLPFPTKAEIDVLGDDVLQEKLRKLHLAGSEGQPSNRLAATNRTPSNTERKADVDYLATLKGVKSVSLPPDSPSDEDVPPLSYVVEPFPQEKTVATFTAGVKYTAESGPAASLGLETQSVPGEIESIGFKLEGGESVFSVEGDLRVAWDVMAGSFWDTAEFVASAFANEDDEKYSGNIRRGAFTESIAGGKIGMAFKTDSASPEEIAASDEMLIRGRNRWRRTLQIETGLQGKAVDLDGPATSLTGLDKGTANGPYLHANLEVEYDARNQAKEALFDRRIFSSDVRIDSGLEMLGSDWNYLRASTAMDLRLLMETAEKPLGFILVGATAAWASGNTPTFDLCESGGERYVRGLREDEMIGREYVGLRFEAGVNIPLLFRMDLSQNTELPPQIRNLYLVPFVDAGWLSDRVEDGQRVSGGRSLQGYGIQLELYERSSGKPPFGFAFGYALSPQSRLQESGTFFSHLTYNF
jgi:hypothetical protein